MVTALLALGEALFQHSYPLYRPLYAAYKSVADRQERAVLRQLVRPGMTVVDVGAHVGVYTQYLAQLVGPRGHVHAFEPSPVNYARLAAAVRGVGNVTAVQAAAGERPGTTDLFLSTRYNVDHRTFDTGEGRPSIEVRVVSLDAYFPAGARIDLVKIDVQGAECAVVRGADRIIRQNMHLQLLIEFWPYGLAQAGVHPRALLDMLASLDLTWTPIGGAASWMSRGEFDTTDPRRYCNLIAHRPVHGTRV